MVALVLASLISAPVIGPANAQVPVLGPMQFVQCKVDAGNDMHYLVSLPGDGQPEGWGKALAGFLNCGPFPGPFREPGAIADTAVPVFGPMQFVQCKVDAGNDMHYTVFLPGDGQPEGWGKALAGFLNCGPLPGPFKER
jgi:hypothetical protein